MPPRFNSRGNNLLSGKSSGADGGSSAPADEPAPNADDVLTVGDVGDAGNFDGGVMRLASTTTSNPLFQ